MKHMTTAEAAKYLGLSAGTLANYRSWGQGPTFIRADKRRGQSGRARVLYRKADLDAWREAGTCPTCGAHRPNVLLDRGDGAS